MKEVIRAEVTEFVQVSSLSHVQPNRSLVGFAGVNVHNVLTVSALHRAAPLELALALGDTFDAHGVVASSAAHDLAAICASRGPVAHSASCAQGAWREIRESGSKCLNSLHFVNESEQLELQTFIILFELI